MPDKSLRFCNHAGCSELTTQQYCPAHMPDYEQKTREAQHAREKARPNAQARGYDSRWQKYSTWFLRQPENQICRLHLDSGCADIAQCVDHIDPPDGPNDPRFWRKSNHQPSCIHCNSMKGHRKIIGTYEL